MCFWDLQWYLQMLLIHEARLIGRINIYKHWLKKAPLSEQMLPLFVELKLVGLHLSAQEQWSRSLSPIMLLLWVILRGKQDG